MALPQLVEGPWLVQVVGLAVLLGWLEPPVPLPLKLWWYAPFLVARAVAILQVPIPML